MLVSDYYFYYSIIISVLAESSGILPPTPPLPKQPPYNHQSIPAASQQAPKRKRKHRSYTYESAGNGWIRCRLANDKILLKKVELLYRVPVKMSPLYDFGLKKNENEPVLKKRPPSVS